MVFMMLLKIELLLETLKKLSFKQRTEFKVALLSKADGCFSNQLTEQTHNMQDLVFLMVQTYGQQSVEETKEILKKIRRDDLVQKLSFDCSRSTSKKIKMKTT